MANVTFSAQGDSVCAHLSGEIDHDSAQKLRHAIDAAVSGRLPRQLVMDFAQVEFMDSSGVGLILGRKRRMQAMGGTLAIAHAPAQIERILQIAQIECLEGSR